MNSILFETKQHGNCMGTKGLNFLGTNRLSWVKIVWVPTFHDNKTSGIHIMIAQDRENSQTIDSRKPQLVVTF